DEEDDEIDEIEDVEDEDSSLPSSSTSSISSISSSSSSAIAGVIAQPNPINARQTTAENRPPFCHVQADSPDRKKLWLKAITDIYLNELAIAVAVRNRMFSLQAGQI
ncbi:MAG: hypothetical protein F6K04_22125, partial [Leptolyngbya sp. SIO4C5]|nr:hypothetical protein [Leptolyngbya sp. SIO4C5]